jgi:hypothetical protein
MNEELRSRGNRRRGGQPGNTNAFKHGRYARSVSPSAGKDAPDLNFANLETEISMLRTTTRQIFELVGQAVDIDQMIKLLGALGLASIRTSRLLKSQKELGNGGQALNLIEAALRDVLPDWNLK